MRTHHLLKLATALLLATLFSCEKETAEIIEPEPVTIEPPHNSSITTEILSENELAPLIGYIEKRTGKSASKDGQGGTHIETGFGTIYLDHAQAGALYPSVGEENVNYGRKTVKPITLLGLGDGPF